MMMSSEARYTLRELECIFGGSTPDLIRLRMSLAETHEERLRQVEAAIDWIVQEHSKTRQHRYDRDENALTIDVIEALKAMGFDASHDKDYGGHCDITIEAKSDFLWIGEAKIHKDYDWLLKGFEQLDTRYSTGLPGQDAGGIIIYCKGPRIDKVMKRWSDHLAHHRPDVTVEVCDKNRLVRRSRHTHERTGAIFRVRHVPVSLHFKPNDTK